MGTSFKAPSSLRSEQVASILGVTKRTLKTWLKNGKIPEPRRNPANNYRVWSLADVEAIRRILQEQE
jgi:excisionase family DNA binding protein